MSEHMSDIDEVSQTLGKLEATIENHGKAHTAIIAGIEQIKHNQVVQDKKLDALHTRVDYVEGGVRDYKKTKQRGLLALVGLGAAGGAGSTGIMKILAAFIGGGH